MDETPTGTERPSELQEPPLSTERPKTTTAAPESDVDLAAVAPEVLADSLGEYVRAWVRRIRAGESGALPIVARPGRHHHLLPAREARSSARTRTWSTCSSRRRSTSCSARPRSSRWCCRRSTCRSGYVLGDRRLRHRRADRPAGQPAVVAGNHRRARRAPRLIGYLQGSIITRLHVPSFVVTLAGLLIFEGVMIQLANSDKSRRRRRDRRRPEQPRLPPRQLEHEPDRWAGSCWSCCWRSSRRCR